MTTSNNIDYRNFDLPESPEIVARLRLKLEEYQLREKTYLATTADSRKLRDVQFKIRVLSKLLETGSIDIDTLKHERGSDYDFGDKIGFEFACRIIYSYCYPDGNGFFIAGGTGLPRV